MPDHEYDLPEQVLAAARDDLAAYRPGRTPPFAALQARKRGRDLRRGGGAMMLSVVAVAAVAALSSSPVSLGGDGQRGPQGYAAPGPGPTGSQPSSGGTSKQAYSVSWTEDPAAYNDDVEDDVQRCFTQAAAEQNATLLSRPPIHSGTVTGQGRLDALRTCVTQAAPGATFNAPAPGVDTRLSAEQQAFVRECVGPDGDSPAPEFVGLSETESNTVGTADPARRVIGRDGTCLGRTFDSRPDRVNLIIDGGQVIWAGRF